MLDDGTMDIDILIRPLDEDVQSRIGDAAAWPGYAGKLRDVLDICIQACGGGSLRISGLAQSGPLPKDQTWLREGVSVPAGRAAEVFVEMMGRSDGATFSLVGGDVLRTEVTGAGFDLFLADAGWYAVVPRPDGVLRKWEDPARAG
ncbi:hypothetical protein GCM10011609_44460 [Lentzea pudingi]|uniref:Uncharacterized protein n=1 Tax=Lentzea pudingi TaxID=1789439 RepID=A0ABQ2I8H3_9PSEU|nr:hypothetical protein [Lentzea pudingi]GGN01003.1 hypothetical protein GCM10011609_44460 [Lentzea pudingi]